MSDPIFSDIIGHDAILHLLSKAIEHPASGYLFCGPDGVGKRFVAERFAAGLLQQDFKTSLDAHPDFIRLVREEDAKNYSVEQARQLVQRMGLSSARGGKKIAFIADAERLQDEATNALLKAVEEPHLGSVYLFITEEPDRLPATLRSRLTQIMFGRISHADMQTWIRTEALSPEREARFLLRASGCPGIVKRCIRQDDVWTERERSVREAWQYLVSGTQGKVCEVLEHMAQRIDKQDDPEAEWHAVLLLLMQECRHEFAERPAEASRIAHGLFHAWKLVGSSLSPRLALEWSGIQTYLIEEPFIPSFLKPEYL